MRLRTAPAKGSTSREVRASGRLVGAIPLGILAPLVIGSAAFVLSRRGLLLRLFRNQNDSRERARRLSRAIVGNDKHSIAAALGSPQASAGAASPQAVFLASTWYYRLDSRHRLAIAIEFENDIARAAHVLHIERPPASHQSGIKRVSA